MKLNMFWSVEPESTHLPDEPNFPLVVIAAGFLPEQMSHRISICSGAEG